ncbi:DUF4956 domain-containing protein [Horticoccus sp. 23ND18S-11]|uniref:DUF4956 domain-containing protein n=1 Tax=Horticoccus sp. 23ND18S-11 TaxID=3391832 RepID=UPI0039C9A929
MNAFLQGDHAAAPTSYQALIIALVLAYLCGQLIAWVYVFTHSGVSYSRSFVVSLIVLPVLVALVLIVMSNNIITAFGLIAVFAVVRFRNALRDTLDTCFVLAVIILGTGCGTQKFSSSVIGAIALSGLFIFLWMTASGTRHRFDLILNLRWTRPASELPAVGQLLQRHSLRVHVANQHFGKGNEAANLSYRVLLRDPSRAAELLTELAELPGVDRVSSVQAADESEI